LSENLCDVWRRLGIGQNKDGARAVLREAEVIGESRARPVVTGTFDDEFAAYGVHLYRLKP